MKRILVTGASGCVGRFAVPALVSRGWQVDAVSSRPVADQDRGQSVAWHTANLLDAAAVDALVAETQPSHLLHLAWNITPGRWAAAPENVPWVRASLRLYEQFRAHGGKRFVGAGSCLEYDWEFGYCQEGVTPRRPATLYGVCKNAVHDVLARAAVTDGLSFAWARIFFLYGPHEHPDRLVAAVIRSLLAATPARTSHGRQVRDYLYVADVAEALVQLAESEVTGAFNIASGTPVALRDIIGRIGQMLGRTDLIQFGAIAAAPTDTPLVVGDPRRLEEAIGWRPSVGLDEGLQATIDWWRRQSSTDRDEAQSS